MEITEPLMDCNFPELLVENLGRSEGVFSSKQLTAGTPVPTLVDDGSKRRHSLQDSSTRLLPSHSQGILSNMKSLRAVDRAYCKLFIQSFGQPSRPHSGEFNSSSSESSGGMEPPSIGTRDVSVTTRSTSVTSDRISSESGPKSSRPMEQMTGDSWMDFSNEDSLTFEERRRNNLARPPSPPRSFSRRDDVGNLQRSMTMGSRVAQSDFGDPFTAFSDMGTPKPQSRFFEQPKRVPQRRSSLNHNLQPSLSSLNIDISPRSPPSPSQFIPNSTATQIPTRITPPPLPTRHRGHTLKESATLGHDMPPPAPVSKDKLSEGKRSMEQLESGTDIEVIEGVDYVGEDSRPPMTEPNSPYITSPMINVEKWLESSIDAGLSLRPQANPDNTMSVIPLPPEVLDTLRISVTCFPETMLLCSSLSIETLRSHSKKVRFASSESQFSLSFPDGSPKPSKWKRLTTKRPPEQPPAKLQPRQASTCLEPRSAASYRPQDADWAALKRIFPHGTDYLCEALYAHILAYNYITLLCPRSFAPAAIPRPDSKGSSIATKKSQTSDNNKIPTKAANLLGLQNAPSRVSVAETGPAFRTNTLRSKASFLSIKRKESGRTFLPSNNRTPENHEQSLRGLRLGLATCIARLVATLMLTSDAVPKNFPRPSDNKEVDPYFMRSLCEIVRCCEER